MPVSSQNYTANISSDLFIFFTTYTAIYHTRWARLHDKVLTIFNYEINLITLSIII